MSVSTMDTMGVLNRIKFKHSELIAAAEEVLHAMALDLRSVDPADKIVFSWLNWDEQRISRELGRVHDLRNWKPKAGTNVEYVEAVELHEAVSESVPKKVADLQSKRDEIQQKIDEESTKLEQAQSRLDGMDYARKRLRDLVPPHIRKKYEDEMGIFQTSPAAERMRALKSRRTTIQNIVEKMSKVDASTIRSIFLYCESHLRSAIPPPSTSFETNFSLNEQAWFEHLASLRVELIHIESEIPSLQIDNDEAIAEVETILDYYTEGKL